MKIINITTNNSNYPVIIGTNILNNLSDYIIKSGISLGAKLLIITDNNVAPLYLDEVMSRLNKFEVMSFTVNAGEKAKSLQQVEMIIDYAVEHKLDRSSSIVALGGGVIGDLAGLVAAIYMRGISFIQIPTTILAHDSSVGGKVGVNHRLGKNLIGAFYQPKLVYYDTAFLSSLPMREVYAGLSEVIKHALIDSKEFADWLNINSHNLLNLHSEEIVEALYRGISIKANIVMQDEREEGIRALLNFGHTLAHVIETISNYKYLHGEAVAIGMVFAARIANKIGEFSQEEVQFIKQLIEQFHLPTAFSKSYETESMLEIMLRDKKFTQGKIRMIIPKEIGQTNIIDQIDENIVMQVLEEMKS